MLEQLSVGNLYSEIFLKISLTHSVVKVKIKKIVLPESVMKKNNIYSLKTCFI